jgi:hypothetical protein
MVRQVRLVLALVVSLIIAPGSVIAGTVRNDDSCDISVAPAATLLLPYFEVAVDPPFGATTVVMITNVTPSTHIARVTLWTDYSYPALTFDLYLTGYDVQRIDLADILVRGRLGDRLGTGKWVSPVGEHAENNRALDLSQCDIVRPRLDAAMLARVQELFLSGRIPGCAPIADYEPHENAVGYATIDVVGNCSGRGPTDPLYFSDDLRYDNALIGDFLQIDDASGYAQGNPLVHIRAIPEGGRRPTRLAQTFYSRLQPASSRTSDARQPLPSTFALRWIEDKQAGLHTVFKIWREGVTRGSAACGEYEKNFNRTFIEAVLYDEDENGEGLPEPICCFSAAIGEPDILLPSTSAVAPKHFNFSNREKHSSGWLYLDLNGPAVLDPLNPLPQQNWVVASMRVGRLTIDMDAAWLGNGCSAREEITEYNEYHSDPAQQRLPGPARDVNP